MIEIGRKCLAFSCTELAAIKGLCSKHYKRMQRHGSTEVRKTSGGSTSVYKAMQHPLYTVWRSVSRVNKGQSICERWKLFENFVQDVPESLKAVQGYLEKIKQSCTRRIMFTGQLLQSLRMNGSCTLAT